jgi:hypothetical protein
MLIIFVPCLVTVCWMVFTRITSMPSLMSVRAGRRGAQGRKQLWGR